MFAKPDSSPPVSWPVAPAPPTPLNKLRLIALISAISVSVCVLVATLVWFVFSLLGNSTPATLAIRLAENNAAVTAQTGIPLHRGFWVKGNLESQGSTGTANLTIPVSGPHGKGTLFIQAEETADIWRAIRLEFQPDGQSDRILIVQQ